MTPGSSSPASPAQLIEPAHHLYCQLTAQKLSLGYGRERQWFELLRAGFTLEDLHRVITYLQKEIRHGRRNVGALKLSNLLQPDRFEEDLNISRIRLRPAPHPQSNPSLPPSLPPEERQRRRQIAAQRLRQIRQNLR